MRFFALLACLCAVLFALPTAARATDVVQSWAQTFQNPGGETADIYTMDSKGSVYLASFISFDVSGDFWLIRKLNSLGQLQWTQSFFATERPRGMAADANGNLFITSAQSLGVAPAAITIKILSDGELGWVNEYDGGVGLSVHVDATGNCYVGGYYSSNLPDQLLLVEYSATGEVLKTTQRNDIVPTSTFFMPNGALICNGQVPSSSNPMLEALSISGDLLYSTYSENTSTDKYAFDLGCDSASNIYLAVSDTNGTTNSFGIGCYGPTGALIWDRQGSSGLPQQITASDPNHAYVHVKTGTNAFADRGFGAGGTLFLNVVAQPEIIAADGSKGLIQLTKTTTAFTFTEINADLQTLWSQSYSGIVPSQSLSLNVINSTVYALNATQVGANLATNFVKYVQGIGVTAVTPSKPSIQGGQSVNVTVQLNDVAPANGTVVYFVDNSPTLGLPVTGVVPSGKSTLTVAAVTEPVDVSTTVTIIAEVNGGARTTTVVLTPAVLSTVTFPGGATASVKGGQTITGTIQLSGLTGVVSHAVALSSNSAKATLPATVNVLPGKSTATFVVSTTLVTTSTPVVITAKLGGVTVTAKLTISP